MKTNTKTRQPVLRTAEGTRADRISDLQALRRAVASCMLWEDQFYENGQAIGARIRELTLAVHPEDAAAVAIDAREIYKLRHAPLWIVRALAGGTAAQKAVVEQTLEHVIQRADEITEFMALYWKEGKTPIANCVKRGLRNAFLKFDEYDLAKYDRDGDVKLRDVMFLVHAVTKDTVGKPVTFIGGVDKDKYKRGVVARHPESLAAKLIERRLATPDTWEVQLSGGADKKATFERLIEEKKLGGLALLRNLRNMQQAGVDEAIIRLGLAEMKVDRILPFRFITAAQYAPRMENELEQAMLRCLKTQEKLEGRTALIVDTSPSMWQAKVSAKSEMTRFDAAAALAILCQAICEDVRVYYFNETAGEIPARAGFALRDALAKTQAGASRGGLAIKQAAKDGYDRIVVLTDGQWHPDHGTLGWGSFAGEAIDVAGKPLTDKAYMINVAGQRNAVGNKNHWTFLEGWSEAVIDFIRVNEELEVG